MSNRSLCIKVPGKLMIAGEFAVLEPRQKLVVMAVDRFVYTTIKTDTHNQLTFENFHLERLNWEFVDQQIKIASEDTRTEFVKQAMEIALIYLKEQGINPPPFSLTIRSELDDSSGIKYGLGSSAAVVTSVVTAILTQFLPKQPPNMLIFKLAAISHVLTQGNGSGADIAASTHGGMLQYSSFQADWLINIYQDTHTLTEFVQLDWKYLSIKKITVPTNITMYIGWTGNPASTANLVNKVLLLRESNKTAFQQFIDDSAEAVYEFLRGMKQQQVKRILKGVTLNRIALRQIGEQANAEIETPLLCELSNVAEKYSGAGKPSGAGGGDCGIAFLPSHQSAKQMQEDWRKVGIIPLEIQINDEGTTCI